MPFAFTDHPGLGFAALRAARNDHPVVVSGPAKAIASMVPAIGAAALPNGDYLIPLVAAAWLVQAVAQSPCRAP